MPEKRFLAVALSEEKAKMAEGANMTANEFFRALLAALASKNRTEFSAGHSDIHKAFFRVLREIRKPEIQNKLNIEDVIDIDYDPLYGQSRWFDKALTRAQRDHIISFPNPSYDRINIKYAPEAGKALLDGLESHEAIENLAEIFHCQLEAQNKEQPASR
jgi:hypothetical protein